MTEPGKTEKKAPSSSEPPKLVDVKVKLPDLSNFLVRFCTSIDLTKAYMSIESYPEAFDLTIVADLFTRTLRDQFAQGFREEFFNKELPILLSKRQPFLNRLIAEGIPLVPPVHARLEYKVRHPSREFLIRADGSCDYKNRDLFSSVCQGDVIVIKHSPVPGKEGISVFGKPIVPVPAKDMLILAGKFTIVESGENSTTVVKAETTGQVVYHLSGTSLKIKVDPVLEVGTDVDYHTGNINFKGSVLVKKSILSGFSVVATGNVTVQGMVEPNAGITAGGDIEVGRGILGDPSHNKGVIKAFGNIKAEYAENAVLTAEGDIFLRNAMNCVISANRGLFIEKTLSGGEAIAFEKMVVHEIGNTVGIKSIARTGVSHSAYARLNLIVKILEDLKNQQGKVNKDILFVKEKWASIPALKRMNLLFSLERKRENLDAQIEKLELKKADLTLELLQENSSTISGRMFYPGTTIFIRSSLLKLDREYKNVTFFQEMPAEKIGFKSYLPEKKNSKDGAKPAKSKR
jgi:hypothetical protein